MSSNLEKFIRKNRGDFDDADPSNKVWKDIERSLPIKKEAKRFTIRDIYKWSAAAAIFFIALTSVYFLFIRKLPNSNGTEIPTVKTEQPTNPSRLDNFNSISIEYATQFKAAEQAVE